MSFSMILAGAGLAAAGLLVFRRPRRRTRARQPRSTIPSRLDLADLKAEGQRRVESMRGCRLQVVQATPEGDWLRLVIRVEPPGPEVRWWPAAVSVECPRQLALRDAASQGPPLLGAIPKKLEGYSVDDWRQGRADLTLRVQTPSQCVCLEVGYYGLPLAVYPLENP